MSYLLAQASAHRIPLRDESVQCVVTSPPYFGLRQYQGEQGVAWADGTTYPLGLEPTPDCYVAHMVEVFREVRRVMRRDAVLFLNLGDSYAQSGMGGNPAESEHRKQATNVGSLIKGHRPPAGLKPKDLIGIPWMVAFALRADGFYLRSDIIFSKPNPMPESVTDRPTKSHEYLFLLTKSPTYYYDSDAIREPHTAGHLQRQDSPPKARGEQKQYDKQGLHDFLNPLGRNARSVWQIATQPYPGAHFATFPEELPERCIKAGSSKQSCSVCGGPWERVTELVEPAQHFRSAKYINQDGPADNTVGPRGGTARALVRGPTTGFRPTCTHEDGSGTSVVFDPFNGSGTTGAVALRLGRSYVGLDLSREYLSEQALHRIDPLAGAAQDARTGLSGQQVMAL